ncbi:hypothetical protein B0H66DRAFT_267095 [Apodospora peruviana]|uniref:Uncharacterized protein n=1 Tax=Apodospora peruviana TaxID=516989 RepID=A0AAE0M4Q8_9PEZI|nr:hypothetical protein B0H66DRAFT_267095 [Apodospora peruviana]
MTEFLCLPSLIHAPQASGFCSTPSLSDSRWTTMGNPRAWRSSQRNATTMDLVASNLYGVATCSISCVLSLALPNTPSSAVPCASTSNLHLGNFYHGLCACLPGWEKVWTASQNASWPEHTSPSVEPIHGQFGAGSRHGGVYSPPRAWLPPSRLHVHCDGVKARD